MATMLRSLFVVGHLADPAASACHVAVPLSPKRPVELQPKRSQSLGNLFDDDDDDDDEEKSSQKRGSKEKGKRGVSRTSSAKVPSRSLGRNGSSRVLQIGGEGGRKQLQRADSRMALLQRGDSRGKLLQKGDSGRKSMQRANSGRNLFRGGGSLRSQGNLNSSLSNLNASFSNLNASFLVDTVVDAVAAVQGQVEGTMEFVGLVDSGPTMVDHMQNMEAFLQVVKDANKEDRNKMLAEALISQADGKKYKRKL